MSKNGTKERFMIWLKGESCRLSAIVYDRISKLKRDAEESVDFDEIKFFISEIDKLEQLANDLENHTPESTMDLDQICGMFKWFIISGEQIIKECEE